MTTYAGTPSLGELLDKHGDAVAARLRVMLPGRIESYDASKQLCSVTPMIKGKRRTEEGTLVAENLGVINNVPVIFPGGGGLRITWPLVPGDTVALVFADRSLDVWQDTGGVVDPKDQRTHHLSDAIAIPGLHPNNAAWQGAEPGVITIGADAGAADFVATAQRVLTELNKLKTAYDAHTHSFSGAVTGGGGGTASGTTGSGPSAPALSAPASASLKVRG